MSALNPEVTAFLTEQNHPLIAEIDRVRSILLSANEALSENIKWNGPNYVFEGDDRITMRIHPPKQVQLVFHRGAKKVEVPKTKLINDASGLMDWKTNDRAVITFKNAAAIESAEEQLKIVVNQWLEAAK